MRVNCTVDSCHYWGSGNICEAKEITVRNNVDRLDMEISTMDSLEASTSEQTMCQTYRPQKK